MKKQYYIIIILILLTIIGGFYWYEIRPTSIKKSCFTQANTKKQDALAADNNAVLANVVLIKRADYDKIFNDEYKNCLLKNGVKE